MNESAAPRQPPRESLLAGFRVGLLEARRAAESAALVQRMGGIPICAPALREQAVQESGPVAAFLDQLSTGELATLVMQTGVGVAALFQEARSLGREPELRRALGRAAIVSRGPKTAAALAASGLRPTLAVPSPFTTREILTALDTLPLAGTGVGLVQYGEPNAALAAALRGRGASVHEITLYEWRLPEDTTALRSFVSTLLSGGLDAVAFTAQIQVRHLFEICPLGDRGAMVAALGRTVVGAIGPTCAESLREHGVPELVVPTNPKLGPLLLAIAARLAERQ